MVVGDKTLPHHVRQRAETFFVQIQQRLPTGLGKPEIFPTAGHDPKIMKPPLTLAKARFAPGLRLHDPKTSEVNDRIKRTHHTFAATQAW